MKLCLWLIIISDRISSGQKQDKTRKSVASWCQENEVKLTKCRIVADEKKDIQDSIQSAIDDTEANLIITSGGTGFGPRDKTPESTHPFLEKLTPGIDEYLRREGTKETPYAILTRGISGIAKNKLIINMPGNPAAVVSGLDALKDQLSGE